jgi:hypothetical protein
VLARLGACHQPATLSALRFDDHADEVEVRHSFENAHVVVPGVAPNSILYFL